ncbi:hypothetical protein EYF80_032783 [Liparis tanakae]|uniref:Uncharacterized protein n=1 Tax=Liparis tanakae TaxID=230148 RepID=A0A4Z2GW29_9TELE|nr:hypothetical protein EYF80_032783 [Liparis tanakae]
MSSLGSIVAPSTPSEPGPSSPPECPGSGPPPPSRHFRASRWPSSSAAASFIPAQRKPHRRRPSPPRSSFICLQSGGTRGQTGRGRTGRGRTEREAGCVGEKSRFLGGDDAPMLCSPYSLN